MEKLKQIRYRFRLKMAVVKSRLFGIRKTEYKDIPIIINNFNRYDMLLRLIASLESKGYTNIHIIDNASSYPPLLEYYEHCRYHVIRLKSNVGYLALWKTGLYKMFNKGYFAYTDADVEIIPECPDDFMEKFVRLLEQYPRRRKVGFSLLIDDLPDTYRNKKKVVEWESQFWKKEIEPGVYDADVDTTFALYRPYLKRHDGHIVYDSLRTGYPYSARHLPWYQDSSNQSEEEKFYLSQIVTKTHWSETN